MARVFWRLFLIYDFDSTWLFSVDSHYMTRLCDLSLYFVLLCSWFGAIFKYVCAYHDFVWLILIFSSRFWMIFAIICVIFTFIVLKCISASSFVPWDPGVRPFEFLIFCVFFVVVFYVCWCPVCLFGFRVNPFFDDFQYFFLLILCIFVICIFPRDLNIYGLFFYIL